MSGTPSGFQTTFQLLRDASPDMVQWSLHHWIPATQKKSSLLYWHPVCHPKHAVALTAAAAKPRDVFDVSVGAGSMMTGTPLNSQSGHNDPSRKGELRMVPRLCHLMNKISPHQILLVVAVRCISEVFEEPTVSSEGAQPGLPMPRGKRLKAELYLMDSILT